MNDRSSSLFNALSLTTSATIQGGWWGYQYGPGAATQRSESSTISSALSAESSRQPVAPLIEYSASGRSQSLTSALSHSYSYGYYGRSRGLPAAHPYAYP